MPIFTPNGQLFVDNNTGKLFFSLKNGEYMRKEPYIGATLSEARSVIINEEIRKLNVELKILKGMVENSTKIIKNPPRGMYNEKQLQAIRDQIPVTTARIIELEKLIDSLLKQSPVSEQSTLSESNKGAVTFPVTVAPPNNYTVAGPDTRTLPLTVAAPTLAAPRPAARGRGPEPDLPGHSWSSSGSSQ
jgi:hypothetical protein